MKKLFLILLFIPIVSYGQDFKKLLEDQLVLNSFYLEEAESLLLLDDDDMSKQFRKKSIENQKNNYEKLMKLRIAFTEMYIFNIDPISGKPDYFELFWKRAVESFGFVDTFSFREKYGHSYRDKKDYGFAALKELQQRYRFNNNFRQKLKTRRYNDFDDNTLFYYPFSENAYSNYKRSFLESFIEITAMCIPLIIYTFFIIFIFKSIYFKKNIFKKYLFFGYLGNSNLRKNTKKLFNNFKYGSILIIIYLILDNLRLISVRWSLGKFRLYNSTPNDYLKEALEGPYIDIYGNGTYKAGTYNFINTSASIREPWLDLLPSFFFLFTGAYIIAIIVALYKDKKF